MYPTALRRNQEVHYVIPKASPRSVRKAVPPLLLLSLFFVTEIAWSQGASTDSSAGEALFEDLCTPCHTIGDGDLVGPDLSGVQKRRPREWIVSFLSSPESVIEGGDPYADSLYQKYEEMMMPDMDLSETDIASMLAYITAMSPEGAGAGEEEVVASPESKPLEAATTDEVEGGIKLFQGITRFEAEGP